MKEAEKLTNMHVDFGLAPSDGVGEKRNLALTSGDYPEVFYRTGIPAGDIAKYGEQGTFVPLNDLMDEYMPNLTAIMDDNPTISDGVTLLDGIILSALRIYGKGIVVM